MGNLPISSITVHYNKKSKVVAGHLQSFKIILQPQGPFNDSEIQSLKKTISRKSRINYRPIYGSNDSFGVLGFVPKGLCNVYCVDAKICSDFSLMCSFVFVKNLKTCIMPGQCMFLLLLQITAPGLILRQPPMLTS